MDDPEGYVRRWWDNHNLCYCGSPEKVLRELATALWLHNAFNDSEGYDQRIRLQELRRWVEGNGLLAYLLDSMGLTDHGSSIYCGFLTEEGRELLTALDAVNHDTVLRHDGYDLYEGGR